MIYYRQCLLERAGVRQVSWIPNAFVFLGAMLRLKENGVWENGWRVVEVWQMLPDEMVPDQHALRRAHKRATGDVSA